MYDHSYVLGLLRANALCATRVWLPQQVRVQRPGFSVADSVDEPELRPKADTGAQARRGESLRLL